MTTVVTRFAPSPTGLLHLGHAFAAIQAWSAAVTAGGRFLVRIEDIDLGRCRPEYEAAILEDLAWLGLSWEQPVRRQSDHMADYRAALDRLAERELLYPCFCTRKDIQREIAGMVNAPHGPDGPRYPGTCRGLSQGQRDARLADGAAFALRLDVAAAMRLAGPLTWHDDHAGELAADPNLFGDVVLARKDVPTSYHLAVVVDDHLQGVNLVTRGRDLFAATHVHRLLQAILDYPAPRYRHHRLLADESGRRLAKRHDAAAIRHLRNTGEPPSTVYARAGLAGRHRHSPATSST